MSGKSHSQAGEWCHEDCHVGSQRETDAGRFIEIEKLRIEVASGSLPATAEAEEVARSGDKHSNGA